MAGKFCDSCARVNGPVKIVITGASGFIGRHVMPVLIRNKDIDAVAVTRNKKNLSYINGQCEIIEHDLSNEDISIYKKLGQPDVLLHLAWDGLPNYASLHHYESELPKHYNFIKRMVKSGLKSVAVVGTCFEYGMQSGKLSEEMPVKLQTSYGFAKDALRRQLQFLGCEDRFKLTWMRLFYIYGEDQPANTLYSQLRAAVQRGDTAFNMSGGEQIRDYLNIGDVVKVIESLLVKNEDYGVVNVCSGKPISVRSLVEQWISENGWSIDLNLGYYDYSDYEPMEFWGSIEKLEACLS